MRMIVGGLFLVVTVTAYGGDEFVAARPPKAGLWENTILSSAHMPSGEMNALTGMAMSVSGSIVSNSQVDATTTEATERICWTDAELRRVSSKSDTELALRAMQPDVPCQKDEPLPGNVTLYCRIDEEHGMSHAYRQTSIDSDSFVVQERFDIVNVKNPATSIMGWQMTLTSHWLGPDCKVGK